MTIYTSFSEIDIDQWQQLIEESTNSSFFQTPECYGFFSSLSFMEPFVYGVSEGNKLMGVIVGSLIHDGVLLKRYLSRRAIVSGGALLHSEISSEALQSLLGAIKGGLKHKAIYLELRNYSDYSIFKPSFESAGFKYVPHLNFHVATPTVETSMKNLKATKRRYVKISQREGAEWYETKRPDDIADFYEILTDLYKNKIKTPLFPLEFFLKLNQLPTAKLLVVKYKDKIIGGSQNVLLSDRTFYEWFVCGLDGKFKGIYPSTLATWAAIECASSNGFQKFDMMGAGKPNDGYGVRDFKSEFGGELVEHGRFQYTFNQPLFGIGRYGISVIRSRNNDFRKRINNLFKNAGDISKSNNLSDLEISIESNIKNINKQEWSDFVKNHPQGNIFQTPELYNVYEKTCKITPFVTIAKNKEGKIVGCLMSAIQKQSEDFTGIFTTRSIVMGGPLVLNNDTLIADKLLFDYNQSIQKKAIYSQFRNMTDMSAFKDVFNKNGFELIPHLDILLDLTQSEEQLFQNLHKERKRNISQAINAGLEFRLLTKKEDINGAIELLKATYKRVKVPISRENLFINAEYELKDKIRFFGAFYDNKMIATQIRLCYKDLIYAWYAGSDSEYFKKRPNDFLTWNVLRWSKANNFKIFDFGGAGNPTVVYNVRDYKIKYGGELVNFGRYEKVHKKMLMLIGKKGYRLYKRRKK